MTGPAPAAGAPRPEVAVGAVVAAGEHLLLVRRGGAPEAGRWSVPGGRLEPGETLAQAVEREVAEETGLAVRCGELVGLAERLGDGYHFVILDFHAALVDHASGAPLPVPRAGGDAAEAAWHRRDAVEGLDLVTGLAAFLRHHGVL